MKHQKRLQQKVYFIQFLATTYADKQANTTLPRLRSAHIGHVTILLLMTSGINIYS